MNIEKVYFNATDGLELVGLLHKGESKTKRIIISIHGMTSNCLKKREDVIARKVTDNEIDYFGFNNRGHDVHAYSGKMIGDEYKKLNIGTAYEDVLDSIYDIKGAILEMVSRGYNEIYLQGHSLGCTKIVYSYNRLKYEKDEVLKYIKGIILLSLVDIPKAQRVYLGDNYDNIMNIALDNEKSNNIDKIMPKDSFIHPISTKTYLRYFRDYEDIDFAKYYDENYDYKELNNIDVPLFMRWGNVNEMIEQDAGDLAKMLNEKIRNNKKNINYIDGADHGYTDRYEVLADEILSFIQKY